ncbi:hypothetical protein KUV85_10235 [Nocardioides panacisoli]|uniref:hypothetical protein n=1 Tax=Nocardioides panacisoli TaxID=627624 RepID=UPI001C62A59F|nr:hypothetical protein [Nocardioides panacisoli]QYJ02716.1 hypothetical protein KUV85_10235 [Nocardioides panacisoli]
MSTTETPARSQWVVPGVAVGIGLVYLGAGVLAGEPWWGVGGLLLMTAIAGVLLLMARTSETTRGLLDHRDERIAAIDRDASLVGGMTVVMAALVMFVVEIARGQDGSPYFQLAGLGGMAYFLALVWYRARR